MPCPQNPYWSVVFHTHSVQDFHLPTSQTFGVGYLVLAVGTLVGSTVGLVLVGETVGLVGDAVPILPHTNPGLFCAADLHDAVLIGVLQRERSVRLQ